MCRQLGLELREHPMANLIAGLLIKDADGWPEDQQSIGKVGDMRYLVFPQGRGRIRLYAEFITARNARFGPEDVRRRKHAFNVIGQQPEKLAPILGAVYLGPESSPAEAFTEAYREAISGAA